MTTTEATTEATIASSRVTRTHRADVRAGGSRRGSRWLRGREDDPAWARPALLLLMAAAALTYLWDLTNSGYANEFYAAAVKSGSVSWKALLFGSLDSANSITVDKPPAALWIMGLSARVFGFSSFSLLLPQALMGIATVGLTYATVRRWSGALAGLVAGAIVVLTPVAALMFRFDNPDAFLVLLMTAAAYATVRAVDSATARRALLWMLGCGLLIGLAFLTKMMQGMLVLPALGLAYLVAARFRLGTRLLHLGVGVAGFVVGAGWYVALVSLWPASSRPYIGGSTDNSLWELAIGYNGLGRILGGGGNGGGGGGGNSGFGGSTGLGRLFNSSFATEIGWFLPAALLLLVAGMVSRGRAPRTDRTRAALVLWGGWLVVTALVFSFMEGTIHPYYAIALAPAVGGVLGVGGTEVLRRRGSFAWRTVLAVAVAGTAVWSFALLGTYASEWLPALRWVVLVGGVLGALGFLLAGGSRARTGQRLATVALLIGAFASAGGAGAWTVATVLEGHHGSIPTAGPSSASSQGGPGGQGGGHGGPGGGGQGGPKGQGGPGNQGSGQQGQVGPGGVTSDAEGSSSEATSQEGQAPQTSSEGGTSEGQSGTTVAQGGGAGNTGSSSGNAELVSLLDDAGTTWSAAVVGDQSAAGYILSTDTAVMAIGGWSGSDDSPTLAQFQADVAAGKIHYFIAGSDGGGGGRGGSDSSASQIQSWVESHFSSTTVGGTTVYDLTSTGS